MLSLSRQPLFDTLLQFRAGAWMERPDAFGRLPITYTHWKPMQEFLCR